MQWNYILIVCVVCIWSPGACFGRLIVDRCVCNWPRHVSAGICEDMSVDGRRTQSYLFISQPPIQTLSPNPAIQKDWASNITSRLHQMRAHVCVCPPSILNTASQKPLSCLPLDASHNALRYLIALLINITLLSVNLIYCLYDRPEWRAPVSFMVERPPCRPSRSCYCS